MAGLREVVHHLVQRDGVDAVLVVSGDGLTIDHAARSSLDPETIAAMVPAFTQYAAQVGEAASGGQLDQAVLEFGDRMLVLAALQDGNHLLILTTPSANIGALLYDVRRHRPALAELL